VTDIPGSRTKAIVDFERDANGSVSASISVPGERLLGKPLTRLRYEPPHVHFELSAPERTIVFDGARDGDVLSGTLHGGDVSGPLSLRRTGDVPSVPYAQEEVRFKNGDVALAGTLLLPPAPGRHPAVVLIHGSSTPSRNDYRFYGDLFARRGVAALIYDKRDVGGDLGGASRVDLRDLAGDALAGVALLKARGDIDPRRIGLWGHSQGGWVAPIAAAQSSDVAFVISFSGPGVTYAEVTRYADATRLRAHGATEDDVREAMEALARVDDYVRRGGDQRELQATLDEAWRRPWASRTTLPRRVPSPEEIRTWLRWRDLDLDPSIYWERITVPALVLFGELDDVVPARASAARIEAALKRAGNRDVTIRIFPKASHTIQPAPEFLDVMLDWAAQRTK
jgi:dipeptidyl aminopeptidase/acylaminoacyl peptidase